MVAKDPLELLDQLIQSWYEADARRELARSSELAEQIEAAADQIPFGRLRSGPPSVRDYFGFEPLPLGWSEESGASLH